MSEQKVVPVHMNNTFEDFSGISTSTFSNPYDALIAACEDNSVRQPEDVVAYGY
jgi:vesicle-fusing ATPase